MHCFLLLKSIYFWRGQCRSCRTILKVRVSGVLCFCKKKKILMEHISDIWEFCNTISYLKGILSTSCVIFSYPNLLSISVLTFIKWRLTPSYAAKDTIFWQKRPKTIVIRIIVWMTIFKSIHMASFYVNTSWACALFRNNMWFLGKREIVNAWKKADFDGFRDKEE